MLVGYNHNIGYKGEVFHVQTEDSGINSPHIITLLYRGGNILASKKTSYADIVKMGNLSQVVEELMKEQHKDMLRRLKNGEFDERIGLEGLSEHQAAPPAHPQPAAPAPPRPEAAPVNARAASPQPETSRKQQSLDDLIFEFLSPGD